MISEMSIPKFMFELDRILGFWGIKCLDYLDGFEIGEWYFLSSHFLHKKLYVLSTAISNTPVETTENWSHTILSSISTNIWLYLNPSDRIQIPLFWKVIKEKANKLWRQRRIFSLHKFSIHTIQWLSLHSRYIQAII